MTKPQQQFLELLRSGLWGKPADASLFQGEIDWKTILRLATEQTVQVLVANGIETLPKELWPPKVVIFKLMEIKTKTAKMHLLLNSVLAKITTALNTEGIPSVLLKGQGLAQNYLIPESRICGDIDLYVGEENFYKASDIISTFSTEKQKSKEELTLKKKHTEINVEGVTIEVHRKSMSTFNPRQERLLDAWTQNLLDAHFDDKILPIINFDKVPVKIPSTDFNAVFILYHAAHHMLIGGIGLRQICDWATLLYKHHSEINQTELKANLKRFHLEPVWREFCRVIATVIGLDPKYIPLAPPNIAATMATEFIIKDIFETGNFGHHKHTPAESCFIKRKWSSFLRTTQRFAKLVKIFPCFSIPTVLSMYILIIKSNFKSQ